MKVELEGDLQRETNPVWVALADVPRGMGPQAARGDRGEREMTAIGRRTALVAGAALVVLAGCAPAATTPSGPTLSPSEPFPSEIPTGVANFAPEGTSVIFLVRHGRTDANDQNLVQGWSDTPLNAQGQAQAAATAEALKDIRFASVLTSDLPRARQTTDAILAANVYPTGALDAEELREQNYGGFDGYREVDFFSTLIQAMGYPFDAAKSTDPANIWSNPDAVAWFNATTEEQRTDAIAAADPLGEAENWALHSVRMQAAAALISLAATEVGNTLVVSHGGTIASLLELMDPEHYDPYADLPNGSVSVVYVTNGVYRIQAIGIPTS